MCMENAIVNISFQYVTHVLMYATLSGMDIDLSYTKIGIGSEHDCFQCRTRVERFVPKCGHNLWVS